MFCSGSAGHATAWGLQIDEGVQDLSDDKDQDEGDEWGSWRKWEVEVLEIEQAEARTAAQQAQAVDQKKKAREEAAMLRDRERLLGRLRRYPDGETERKLRGELAGNRFHAVMESLMDDRLAEPCDVYKGNRKSPLFRVPTDGTVQWEHRDEREKSHCSRWGGMCVGELSPYRGEFSHSHCSHPARREFSRWSGMEGLSMGGHTRRGRRTSLDRHGAGLQGGELGPA